MLEFHGMSLMSIAPGFFTFLFPLGLAGSPDFVISGYVSTS